MTEIDKILITSATTVIGGVVVFVGGQMIVKFIIEPIQALRKTLSDIQYAIFFHTPSYMTVGGKEEAENKAYEDLKKLSSELCANTGSIPLYGVCRFLFKQLIPDKEDCFEAAKWIRGLSNSVRSEDRTKNFDKANKICRLLNLKQLE